MNTYEQRTIGGGAAIHRIRGWKAGELGTGKLDKGPTMPALAPLRRLAKVQAQVRAGIEAAGGTDAYYASGGLAGPFGRGLGKGRRRKAEPKVSAPIVCQHCGTPIATGGAA